MSQLQKAIHRSLRDARLDVQLEYNEGLFSVDFALFLPPARPGGNPRKAWLLHATFPDACGPLRSMHAVILDYEIFSRLLAMMPQISEQTSCWSVLSILGSTHVASLHIHVSSLQ